MLEINLYKFINLIISRTLKSGRSYPGLFLISAIALSTLPVLKKRKLFLSYSALEPVGPSTLVLSHMMLGLLCSSNFDFIFLS